MKSFLRCAIFVLLGTGSVVFGQQSTPGTRGISEQQAVVNFSELAKREALAPAQAQQPRPAHPVLRPAGKTRLPAQQQIKTPTTESFTALALAPSPAPTTSFLAILDDGTTIPPDTMGAVGPNHVMTTLNSQVRIQNRAGTSLSTVNLNSFWASLGNPDAFDPHITYDPFNDRWIFSALANSDRTNAAVLVGVSSNSNPTGNWFLFKADVDPANQNSADFDGLGFNKDWVVVTANIFGNNNGPLQGVWVWAFDKADLYGDGAGAFTLLKFVDNDPDFFTFSVAPARMLDNSAATMYLVEDWDNAAGRLRVSTITGPVGSELLTAGVSFPTSASAWDFFGGNDFLPQLGSTHGIDAGDSRIQSCFYRNGSLWASHVAFVPPGAPTRAVAQWWQFLPGGTVQQFGRVEDPSGSQFFAYPSLAVNVSNDVLLGYSRFSASQYASANYSFRFATDPPNTLRADTVLRAGQASYFVSDGSANRWGDYSATCVDPLNDLTMWTIQEYASVNDRWSTWWGRIDADFSALKLVLTRPANGISYPSNATVTLTATGFDSNTTFTLVEFFADGAKIGEDGTEPYAITWTGASNGAHSLTAIGTETGGGMTTSQVVIITVGDPASPIGTWETKISGGGKGTTVLTFGDDFSLTGHGMMLGKFGLFTVSGTWNFDQDHRTAATYIETLNATNIFSGDFIAKVTAGKKFGTTVNPNSVLVARLKLKGVPRLPVPDLSGNWSASVKVGTPTTMETYQFTASPTLLNVLDITGSVTGAVLETAKGRLNFTTEDFPKRSLAGKAKTTSFTAKGTDERNLPVNVKAVKQ